MFLPRRRRNLVRPEVPPAPGPLDRIIAEPDGLGTYSTNLTAAFGNIIIRVAYRTNAASVPNLSATCDGVPMTKIGEFASAGAGNSGVAAFAIRGAGTGNKALQITNAGGSAGCAVVRIGELATLAASFVGTVDGDSNTNSTYEIDFESHAQVTDGTSQIATIAAWADTRAFPISMSYDDIEQLNTVVPNGSGAAPDGLSARFATDGSPSGEANELFVSYTGSGGLNAHSPAMMVFELKGATLP